MKWTASFTYTLKENPADAEIPSHILMTRAGMIRKVAPGIYTLGNMALRAVRKFENIVRDELNKRGCVEILMPMVHPRELWEESGRWPLMGQDLLKFKNRNDHDFCLGATHEEVITDYVRREVKSYRDLPINIYQIQTKYRDEIRPRFGLMRGREFIMKDAYSFDVDKDGAFKNYDLYHDAYTAIFNRLGVEFRVVQADSGKIGGDKSQEFHVLAASGEDGLLVGDGGFAANVEVCPALDAKPYTNTEELKPLEEFATPGQKSIPDLAKFLKVPDYHLVKTLFYSASNDPKKVKPVCVLLRGNDEINPVKLKKVLGLDDLPLFLTDSEVKEVSGANPGSCGPVGLKMPIYVDNSIKGFRNFVTGANKDGFHLRNVNYDRDFKATSFADLRMAKEGDLNPNGQGKLKAVRGIEVGHIFYLGQKYSSAMNAKFLAADGAQRTLEMGCYGIGITRTVQAVIEQSHDADGMIWPFSITPYHVHLTVIDIADAEVKAAADKIYSELHALGLEVFMDDRDERPGVKFKDADLLGFPLRINIGKRGLANKEVELVERKTKSMTKLSVNEVVKSVQAWASKQPR